MAHINNILVDAVDCNLPEIVKICLRLKADVDFMDNLALKKACSIRVKTELVKLLLKHGANVNCDEGEPLLAAAYSGNIDTVKTLIKAGATMHPRMPYPLLTAIEHGHLEIVKILLKIRPKGTKAFKWSFKNLINEAKEYKQKEIENYLVKNKDKIWK